VTLTAVTTKFEDKIGYNSHCIRYISKISVYHWVFEVGLLNSTVTDLVATVRKFREFRRKLAVAYFP